MGNSANSTEQVTPPTEDNKMPTPRQINFNMASKNSHEFSSTLRKTGVNTQLKQSNNQDNQDNSASSTKFTTKKISTKRVSMDDISQYIEMSQKNDLEFLTSKRDQR